MGLSRSYLVVGLALTELQDLVLGLVRHHEVCTGPPRRPLQVPLDAFPSLRCADRSTQLGVISKPAAGALSPAASPANNGIKRHQSQSQPRATPLVTDLHRDAEPWSTALRVKPSSRILIQQLRPHRSPLHIKVI